MPINYIDLARVTKRPAFVAGHDYRFLGGSVVLRRPPRPDATRVLVEEPAEGEQEDPTTVDPSTSWIGPPAPAITLLVAIRKVQSSYPSMITVGRTANNDIVLLDTGVSKFHAWFRAGAADGELVDAGSRNGTWVGEYKLPGKGTTAPTNLGDRIRFGTIELTILDAGGAWDLAHT